MFVKNTSPKVLGFGKMMLLPDAVDNLPEGFDKSHPTIKFYFARKWLAEATPDEAAKPEPQPEPELTEAEKAELEALNKADALEKELKALKGMNKAQLQTKATELGVEFKEDETNAVLADKISAKLNEAE